LALDIGIAFYSAQPTFVIYPEDELAMRQILQDLIELKVGIKFENYIPEEHFTNSGYSSNPEAATTELTPQQKKYQAAIERGKKGQAATTELTPQQKKYQAAVERGKKGQAATTELTPQQKKYQAAVERGKRGQAAKGVTVGKPADDVSTTVAEKAHFLHDQDLYISPSGQAGNLDTEYLDALEATMGDDALERGVPLVGDRTA
jgi:hypothetical protein